MAFIYKLKKEIPIRSLKQNYNIYYHKGPRIWGIGAQNQNIAYFAIIVNRELQFIDYAKNKKQIELFLQDLQNKNWITKEYIKIND